MAITLKIKIRKFSKIYNLFNIIFTICQNLLFLWVPDIQLSNYMIVNWSIHRGDGKSWFTGGPSYILSWNREKNFCRATCYFKTMSTRIQLLPNFSFTPSALLHKTRRSRWSQYSNNKYFIGSLIAYIYSHTAFVWTRRASVAKKGSIS